MLPILDPKEDISTWGLLSNQKSIISKPLQHQNTQGFSHRCSLVAVAVFPDGFSKGWVCNPGSNCWLCGWKQHSLVPHMGECSGRGGFVPSPTHPQPPCPPVSSASWP